MDTSSFFPFNNPLAIFLTLVWVIFWKGIALWRAAKNSQRNWFIAILIISSFGIIDILYLFLFSKKRLTLTEMKGWIKK